MPRDFDRHRRTNAPKPLYTSPFVTEESRPKRQPVSTWRLIARFGAMLFAFMVLTFFLGINIISCVLAPLAGLALYEVWYMKFESSS
jgi:4-hydroxybenzoate polyprenyltransferase